LPAHRIGAWPDGGTNAASDAVGTDRKEDTMKSILIATDGSPSAQEAVAFGLGLAEEHDAEPVIVHVVPAVDVVPGAGFGMTAAHVHDVTELDWAPLEEAAEIAGHRGKHVRTKLLRGDAVQQIVAYADSIDAELIVMGSRGHGAILNTLLGSVSHGILHAARRPVLIVREASVPAEATVTA
jgi:nucleotide-binding universal stress UspA family protein